MKKQFFLFPLLFLFSINLAKAHCPLCTVGAAVAAGGAAYLGVDSIVIGLIIGAFAVSMGWWISRLIKKKIMPFQKTAIILLSFITTVIPLKPLLSEIKSIPIYWVGSYGSLFNRTYIFDAFLFGSIIGGFIVCITPWISKKISERRGKMMPYQGIILTLSLLMLIGIIMQVLS